MSRANSGNAPESAAAQIKEKASEVVSGIKDMGANVRDAAAEQYDHLRDTATEYYQSGRDKAMQWESQVEDYVREQPIKSLLMAAGVGVLLGVLWKRS